MKISTKIRYGARALIELACRYGEGPIELKEIARKERIPLKYLEQVIIPLRAGGLVKSVRGSKGGYALARPPSEIRLSDVVEAVEGPTCLVECVRDPGSCERSSVCVTRDVWAEVTSAIHGVFYSITMEEMVRRKREREGSNSPMYQI